MKRSTVLTPSVALVALALVSSTTAFGQQRERSRDRGERQAEGRAVERGERRSETPRGDQPREQQRAEAPRQAPAPAAPQQQAAPRVEPQRQERQVERQERQVERGAESRRDGYDGRRNPNRDGQSRAAERAVPRTNAPAYSPRYEPRYAPRYTPRYDPRWNGRYVVPRHYEPRWYQPRFYYRPYVFRPRLSIGFGIFAGYPVPYTYSYPYAYRAYGASYYGGVSLDIAPFNGAVYVDGIYTGLVEDFDGTNEVLTLRAGRHRIEVEAPGYAPLVFDVDIIPGQVIPYRGDLQPY